MHSFSTIHRRKRFAYAGGAIGDPDQEILKLIEEA
jgi:hypothetical protein